MHTQCQKKHPHGRWLHRLAGSGQRGRALRNWGHSSHLRLSSDVRAAMRVARRASLDSFLSSRTTSRSPSGHQAHDLMIKHFWHQHTRAMLHDNAVVPCVLDHK